MNSGQFNRVNSIASIAAALRSARGSVVPLILLLASILATAAPDPAHADAPDCTGVAIVVTENLTLDFTLDNCFNYDTDPTFGGHDDTQDFINIQSANTAGTTNIDLFDQGFDTNTLTMSVNGTPTSSTVVNCSAGCLIEGTYNGTPYSFTFNNSSGTGTVASPAAPEINIQGNGTSITDGDTTPSVADDTDFGSVDVTSGSNANTFTIQNTGTADLTLTNVTSSDSGQFAISGTTNGTIASSGSVTFNVTFDPSSAGSHTATITVSSDDADEGTYTFDVTGVGTTAPGFSQVFAPDAITTGGTSTITFTIDNSANVVAADSLDFTDNLPAGLVIATPANASTTCTGGTLTAVAGTGTLSYTGGSVSAGASCTVSADVTANTSGSLVNTTGDLTSSLGNSGTSSDTLTATGAPEISVSASIGGAVADGGTNAQGTQAAGTPVTVTYTVTNSGTGDLTIATANASTLDNVTVNSIGAPGSTTVAPGGGTTTFTVQYTPTLAGSFSFDLSFDNDDADEDPFNFTVSGTGTGAPEISVSASIGGAVSDGGTNAQGAQAAGTPVTVTYTVTNSGTDDLTLASATSSTLSNVTVNSITAPGSTTVAPSGGTTTFAVQYTPTVAGAFSFNLSFTNDDADENPFNFTVSGTATGAPEISVSASIGGAVSDGGTNAQGTQAAGTPVTVTYTVTNSGTADLTIASATSSTLSNVTVNSITAPGSTTVAPSGGTTTFQVQYTPTVAGAFSFDLSFTNDDADENPFNFTVSGTATGEAEIAVTSSASGSLTDGGTDAQGTQTTGTPVTVTYTITNTGFDTLDIETATASALSNVTVSSITVPGSLSVAPAGGTTSFEVTYTPSNAGAFSFDLSMVTSDADENPFNVTVSGDADGASVAAIQNQIAGFMLARNNHLINAQPDLLGFLSGSAGGHFNADITRGNGTFSVGTSADLPVWGRLEGSWSEQDDTDNSYIFGAVGTHWTLSPDALVGVMVEFDRLSQSEGDDRTDGTGYLAGPYFVARLPEQPLYLEGRVLFGKSRNTLDVDGSEGIEFDTRRLLAQLKAAGRLEYGTTIVTPSLSAIHVSDTQLEFDTGTGTVPEQSVETTDVMLGLDIEHPFTLAGGELILNGGISGIWSRSGGTGFASTVVPAYEGQRARIHLGASHDLGGSGRLSVGAFYDGIGVDDYQSYGLDLTVEARF